GVVDEVRKTTVVGTRVGGAEDLAHTDHRGVGDSLALVGARAFQRTVVTVSGRVRSGATSSGSAGHVPHRYPAVGRTEHLLAAPLLGGGRRIADVELEALVVGVGQDRGNADPDDGRVGRPVLDL